MGRPDQAISILASIAEEEYTAEAHDVRARAQAAIAQERERALARQRLEEAISSVRLLMDKGALVEARARLLEINHSGLPDERIGALQTQLEEMAAAEARRLEEERNLDASRTVVAARRLFATGDASGAVDLLEHKHEHPLVDDALRELRTELARIDERNRQEREQQEIDARQRARAEAESETEKTLIRSPERTIVRPAVTVGHRAKADDARRPENHHHARDAAPVRAEQERPVTQKELTALAEHASRGDIAGQTPAAARPASTRAGIVLLVLALAAGIGLGGYRFFSDGSSASPPVVSEPGSATGGQEAERVAPPDELEKPARCSCESAGATRKLRSISRNRRYSMLSLGQRSCASPTNAETAWRFLPIASRPSRSRCRPATTKSHFETAQPGPRRYVSRMTASAEWIRLISAGSIRLITFRDRDGDRAVVDVGSRRRSGRAVRDRSGAAPCAIRLPGGFS